MGKKITAYDFYGTRIYFKKGLYKESKSLLLEAYKVDDGLLLARFTIEAAESAKLASDEAFIDNAIEPLPFAWLKAQHLATPINKFVTIGECIYRAVKFDGDFLEKAMPLE